MNLQSLQPIEYGPLPTANRLTPKRPAGLLVRPRLIPSPRPERTIRVPPRDDTPTLSVEEQIALWVDANPPQLYRGGA
jgi:hypothetical protein